MELIKILCKKIEVEINEEWKGNDDRNYKITDQGELREVTEISKQGIYVPGGIEKVLNGDIRPIWSPVIKGTAYYMPDIDAESLYYKGRYEGTEQERMWNERGLLFKTKEEAIKTAEKMIRLSREGQMKKSIKNINQERKRWTDRLPIIATTIIYLISISYVTRTSFIKNAKDLTFIILTFITVETIAGYMVEKRRGDKNDK